MEGGDCDMSKDISLAILKEEIERIRKKRDWALNKGYSQIANELSSQLGLLERIYTRILSEFA